MFNFFFYTLVFVVYGHFVYVLIGWLYHEKVMHFWNLWLHYTNNLNVTDLQKNVLDGKILKKEHSLFMLFKNFH